MVALDTNVIVRFLVRDDEQQAQAVYRRFKQAEAERAVLFVPLMVVLELIWVLESAYDKSRREIIAAIQDLRRMPVLGFENDDALQHVLLQAEKSKVDLSDLLIAQVAQSSGCEKGLTFDKAAAKLPFFTLLK